MLYNLLIACWFIISYAALQNIKVDNDNDNVNDNDNTAYAPSLTYGNCISINNTGYYLGGYQTSSSRSLILNPYIYKLKLNNIKLKDGIAPWSPLKGFDYDPAIQGSIATDLHDIVVFGGLGRTKFNMIRRWKQYQWDPIKINEEVLWGDKLSDFQNLDGLYNNLIHWKGTNYLIYGGILKTLGKTKPLTKIYSVDIDTGIWKTFENLNYPPIIQPFNFICNQSLYSLGGISLKSSKSIGNKNLIKYHLKNNKRSIINTKGQIPPSAPLSIVHHNNILYALAPNLNITSTANYLYQLNLDNLNWIRFQISGFSVMNNPCLMINNDILIQAFGGKELESKRTQLLNLKTMKGLNEIGTNMKQNIKSSDFSEMKDNNANLERLNHFFKILIPVLVTLIVFFFLLGCFVYYRDPSSFVRKPIVSLHPKKLVAPLKLPQFHYEHIWIEPKKSIFFDKALFLQRYKIFDDISTCDITSSNELTDYDTLESLETIKSDHFDSCLLKK